MNASKKTMVVAFLDLLGFCNWVEKDALGACQLIQNYQQVLREKLLDAQIDSAEKHSDLRLHQLIEQNAIDSFDFFLPFSDSILISSGSANKFVGQLSTFLIRSYLLTAQGNIRKDRTLDPTLVNVKKFSVRDLQLIGEEKQFWFPVVFRGGISCGEISVVKVSSIVEHIPSPAIQITGMPVVEAVALEKNSGKGPRVFCGPDFLQKLDLNAKSLFRQVDGKNIFELLWPVFHFESPTDPSNGALQFYDLFEPAASLWHHFKNDSKVEPHYFEFIRLIVRSVLHVYPNDKTMRAEIDYEIREFDLYDKKSQLLN